MGAIRGNAAAGGHHLTPSRPQHTHTHTHTHTLTYSLTTHSLTQNPSPCRSLAQGVTGEVYNIGTDKERTVLEVAQDIAKAFNLSLG